MASAGGGEPGGGEVASAGARSRPVELRPLGIGETLDAGLKLFRARARDMVLAAVVVTLPAVVLLVLVQLSTGNPDRIVTTDEATGLQTVEGDSLALFIGGTVVTTVVLLVATNLALAGTMRLSIGVYLGEEVGWRDSLRFALSRWRPLTILVVVTLVASLLALVACIAPNIWLTGIWAVAVPVLLVEDARPIASLRRSRELVRGRFWPVLGTVLLASLLASLLQGVLVAPVIVLQLVEASTVLTALLTGIAQLLGSALTLPFAAAVTAVIYFDLRVRKEGYDLELLARGVGVDPPPDAGPAGPSAPTPPAGGWGTPVAPPGGWGPPVGG